jgi:hypothetical protein
VQRFAQFQVLRLDRSIGIRGHFFGSKRVRRARSCRVEEALACFGVDGKCEVESLKQTVSLLLYVIQTRNNPAAPLDQP